MNSTYLILTITIFLVSVVQQNQSLEKFKRGYQSEDDELVSSEDFDGRNEVKSRLAIDPIQPECTGNRLHGSEEKDTVACSNDETDPEQQVEDLPPQIAIDPIVTAANSNLDQIKEERNLAREGPPPRIAIDPIANPNDFSKMRSGSCSIGTNNGDLPMNQPLLVSPTTNELLQPSKDGFVSIESGVPINLYCTDSFLEPFYGKKKITAHCVEDSVFTVDDQQFIFTEFRCVSMVGNLIKKTSRTCFGGAAIVEVGFQLEDIFIHLMEICHNIEKQVTHYVHYPMGPYLMGYQSGIPRPLFMPGGFFNGADVNRLYTQVQQKLTLDEILGYDTQGFFNVPADVYMARGHMAAKVDFVYAPAQWATFFFINTAPQWQTFNGGNWERLESGVRRFAGDRDLDLDVYSGNWGVMTLPNAEGQHTPLYLAFDKNGDGLIPIPKIYWRVIIDKASKLGVALVGVNNIHATQEQIEQEYVLCNDVSDMIDWIPWDKKNILKGYSYACEVNELVERIGLLPTFDVSGLLY